MPALDEFIAIYYGIKRFNDVRFLPQLRYFEARFRPCFFCLWEKNVFFLAVCLFLRTFVGQKRIKQLIHEKILVYCGIRNRFRPYVLLLWQQQKRELYPIRTDG